MKASYRSVRIAPKKAQLVAKMVRGMRVPAAVEMLEHTNKKAAHLLAGLLRSAMANASHNEKQDPQMMIIKSLIVNKAQSYNRGVPMARGRVRPIRKFLSHIDMILGFADDTVDGTQEKSAETKKNSSQTAKKPVKSAGEKKIITSTKGKSSPKKDTAASTSRSSTPKKSSQSSQSSQSSLPAEAAYYAAKAGASSASSK